MINCEKCNHKLKKPIGDSNAYWCDTCKQTTVDAKNFKFNGWMRGRGDR